MTTRKKRINGSKDGEWCLEALRRCSQAAALAGLAKAGSMPFASHLTHPVRTAWGAPTQHRCPNPPSEMPAAWSELGPEINIF